MADDMDAAIARQRERLTKTQNEVQGKIAELQGQLAEVERQFAAMLAYEKTLAGELRGAAAKRQRTANRGRRGEKQAEVLHVIGQQAGGMTRGEVIVALGVTGSKSGAQSVSNALTALKKADKITSTDGKWQVATQEIAKKAKKGTKRRRVAGAR